MSMCHPSLCVVWPDGVARWRLTPRSRGCVVRRVAGPRGQGDALIFSLVLALFIPSSSHDPKSLDMKGAKARKLPKDEAKDGQSSLKNGPSLNHPFLVAKFRNLGNLGS
ncbi:hypothetical protein HAX54_031962 [Datura stramonium]|uniref:Uncharacterized protein n=1 Tax=Datura stramonium TaxID=4076 RepID=A0ABS8VCU3_DATST|nr:hypothetical protein [Datura stramonium]